MTEISTLTGMSLEQAAAELDAELPPEAYQPVQGGADLTDIDPNHMRKVLNEVFSLCGYGWGYSYNPDTVYTRAEVQVTSKGKERQIVVAIVKYLEVWYRLVIDGETFKSEPIPGIGSSENSTGAYALKGALTNAIGNAVSNIGFQVSVYLGKRSHKTVGRHNGRKSVAGTNGHKPITRKAKAVSSLPDDIEDLDALSRAEAATVSTPAGNGDYGNMVPIGKKAGQKLSELSPKALQWYAHDLVPNSTEAREL